MKNFLVISALLLAFMLTVEGSRDGLSPPVMEDVIAMSNFDVFVFDWAADPAPIYFGDVHVETKKEAIGLTTGIKSSTVDLFIEYGLRYKKSWQPLA